MSVEPPEIRVGQKVSSQRGHISYTNYHHHNGCGRWGTRPFTQEVDWSLEERKSLCPSDIRLVENGSYLGSVLSLSRPTSAIPSQTDAFGFMHSAHLTDTHWEWKHRARTGHRYFGEYYQTHNMRGPIICPCDASIRVPNT